MLLHNASASIYSDTTAVCNRLHLILRTLKDHKTVNYPRKIKALRNKNGWSQADLAAHFGIQQSTVSRWERGETKPVGLYAAKLVEMLSKNVNRGASA